MYCINCVFLELLVSLEHYLVIAISLVLYDTLLVPVFHRCLFPVLRVVIAGEIISPKDTDSVRRICATDIIMMLSGPYAIYLWEDINCSKFFVYLNGSFKVPTIFLTRYGISKGL